MRVKMTKSVRPSKNADIIQFVRKGFQRRRRRRRQCLFCSPQTIYERTNEEKRIVIMLSERKIFSNFLYYKSQTARPVISKRHGVQIYLTLFFRNFRLLVCIFRGIVFLTFGLVVVVVVGACAVEKYSTSLIYAFLIRSGGNYVWIPCPCLRPPSFSTN